MGYSLEEKAEYKKLPRCINCGEIMNRSTFKKGLENYTYQEIHKREPCCAAPRYMSWQELVELQRDTFVKLMKAEQALEQRYLTKEEAGEVLKQITTYKQTELF